METYDYSRGGEYTHVQHVDDQGRPAGGYAKGVGLDIRWQNGPLGRGNDRMEPNGAFVETVIMVAIDRLQSYQYGQFACDENAQALEHLVAAYNVLGLRTLRRERAGVEGTYEGN